MDEDKNEDGGDGDSDYDGDNDGDGDGDSDGDGDGDGDSYDDDVKRRREIGGACAAPPPQISPPAQLSDQKYQIAAAIADGTILARADVTVFSVSDLEHKIKISYQDERKDWYQNHYSHNPHRS